MDKESEDKQIESLEKSVVMGVLYTTMPVVFFVVIGLTAGYIGPDIRFLVGILVANTLGQAYFINRRINQIEDIKLGQNPE